MGGGNSQILTLVRNLDENWNVEMTKEMFEYAIGMSAETFFNNLSNFSVICLKNIYDNGNMSIVNGNLNKRYSSYDESWKITLNGFGDLADYYYFMINFDKDGNFMTAAWGRDE